MNLPDTVAKTSTHWRRGAKDYAWPGPVPIVVEVWWPLADPEPEPLWEDEFPLYWRVKVIRPEWYGRRCRIVIHGHTGNRLIQFADNGEHVVCPGQYLRRA